MSFYLGQGTNFSEDNPFAAGIGNNSSYAEQTKCSPFGLGRGLVVYSRQDPLRLPEKPGLAFNLDEDQGTNLERDPVACSMHSLFLGTRNAVIRGSGRFPSWLRQKNKPHVAAMLFSISSLVHGTEIVPGPRAVRFA
jgi:hypothetical protein